VLHASPDQSHDYVVDAKAKGQELNGDLDEIAVAAAVVSWGQVNSTVNYGDEHIYDTVHSIETHELVNRSPQFAH
jgi:hypothetical protein